MYRKCHPARAATSRSRLAKRCRASGRECSVSVRRAVPVGLASAWCGYRNLPTCGERHRLARECRRRTEQDGWFPHRQRSLHNNVPVVCSMIKPASQPCGRCGVSSHCKRNFPICISSPSRRTRASRSATSFTDNIARRWPHNGTACGATARNSLRAPHSSASKWEKEIHRKR